MGKLLKGVGAALSLGVVAAGLGVAWADEAPEPAAQPGPAPPALPAAPPPRPVVRIPFAPEPPPKVWVEKTFLAAPISTDLPRLLLGGTPASRALVLVDGTALLRELPERGDGSDLLAIWAALDQLRGGRDQPVAHIMVFYARTPAGGRADPPVRERRLLELALDGAAARAGYSSRPIVTGIQPITTGIQSEGLLAARVKSLGGDAGWDAEEPAVGDARARAYPVRTPASRLLTNSAGGVVEVRPRGSPQEEFERSLQAAVTGLAPIPFS